MIGVEIAKSGWQVFTSDSHPKTYLKTTWSWSAWGQRGCTSGMETTAEAAVHKAYAAAELLREPELTR